MDDVSQDAKGKNKIVLEARTRLDEAWTYDRDNREAAAEDMKFAAGDQWPEAIRNQREAQNRPVLTINNLPQFIRQTTNDIRQNAPVIKVIPADGSSDPKLAETFMGLIRQIQYQSSAKHVYASGGEHATTCGIGHFRVTTQFVEDSVFEQEVRIERITNPLSVFWDPAAVEPDRNDADWCLVTQQVPTATFKEKYPNAQAVDVEVSKDGADGLHWQGTDEVLIAEYWRKVPVKRMLASYDGQTIDITDMPKEQLMFMGEPEGTREVDTHKVEQYLVSGAEILSGPNEWPGRHIPIIPIVGSEIPLEKKIVRHGMVRFARDPQRLYNYSRTSAAESIALAPKSPYLVTEKQIGPYKSEWDSANTTNRNYLRYKPDKDHPGVAPTRERPADPPSALWQEAEISKADMQSTIGIYDAGLGARSNETSGVAINERKREGDTANFHYGDNLAHSLTHAGRILVDLIPKIYDTQRTIRILGEDDSEDFVKINQPTIAEDGQTILINDMSQGRFDIRVSIGPSYTTKRVESADSMMQFAKAVPGAAQLIGDLIAKNQDWPGADEIAKRLRKTVPEEIRGPDKEGDEDEIQQPPPDPMAVRMQEMEMRNAELELADKEMAIAERKAKIDKMYADIQNGSQSDPGDPEREGLEKDKIRAETEKTRAGAIHELAKADAADGVIGNLMPQQQTYQGRADDRVS